MLYSLRNIPDGGAGTDATIDKMAEMITASQMRPVVRLSALSILDQNNVNPRNQAAAIRTLFNWTRRNIRYVNDPLETETVQSPEITLQLKAGDCDDHATLMASFAANLGIPARLITIGQHADRMQHVFPEIMIGARWIAADTTQPQPLGFTPRLPVRNVYNLKGQKMRLGTAQQVYPITADDLHQRMYNAAYNQLRLNWQTGLINRNDVVSYLRVIDEGNAPGRGTLAEPAMRQAIQDFLNQIDRTGAVSAKPVGSMNGMEGLDGFLKSVWNAVKKVAGGVVKAVTGVVGAVVGGATGGGGSTVTVQVPSTPGQAATTSVTPGMITPSGAGATIDTLNSLFSSPVFLAAAVGVVVLLLTRRH